MNKIKLRSKMKVNYRILIRITAKLMRLKLKIWMSLKIP